MSSEVPFVRVVPEEIARYGFAGATFIAHIRYRCATDGPGRLVIDGVRWWEVSLSDLAAELRVSKDVAQRTMKRLGEAVASRRSKRPGDQTRAYRVPAFDIALSSQNAESRRIEQPERDPTSDRRPEREIAPVPTRSRVGTGAKSRSVPLSGELEEGGEVVHAPDGPIGGTAVPSPGNALPAQNARANNDPAPQIEADPFDYHDDPDTAPPTLAEVSAAADLPAYPGDRPVFTEPEPVCPKHPIDSGEPCQDCGDARKSRKGWERRRRAFNAERRAACDEWIAACRECDDNDDDGRNGGWVLDPNDERDPAKCPHPRLQRAYAVRHQPSAQIRQSSRNTNAPRGVRDERTG